MIDIKNSQLKIPFTKEMDKLIRTAIKKTLRHQKTAKRSVSVLLTDDDYIKELNMQYREKDCPTDVLSFPLYDENGTLDRYELGDIVISLERASAQAALYNHSIEREIIFLTIHAMLHLLGYDHENDKGEMFCLQNEILDMMCFGSHFKSACIYQSVKHALHGLWACVKNERNFRFHIFAAATIALIMPYYGFNSTEKMLVAVVISTVMICEMFNSAIEKMVDIKTADYNINAKNAKDISAGAVLVSAVSAVVCALLLFLKVDIIHNIIKDVFSSFTRCAMAAVYIIIGFIFVYKGGKLHK